MKHAFYSFFQDQRGASAIEYAVVAAILGVGILTSVSIYVNSLGEAYADVNQGLVAAK